MSKRKRMSRLEAAREYLRRGWAPIPVPLKSKAPTIKGWTKLSVTEKNIETLFFGEGNIGVRLGKDSGGLADIDIDAPDALPFADAHFPETGAIFGRPAKRKSHLLYYCDPPLGKTIKFTDENGGCILEIRSTGGQTIFPPSVHPSGEAIEWHSDGDPARVTQKDLLASARLAGVATILSRHYPAKNQRQDFALTVSNILTRAGYDEDNVGYFLSVLANVVGDEEPAKRGGTAPYSAERLTEGGRAYGLPHLAELIGDAPTRAIAKILGQSFRKPKEPTQRETVFKALAPHVELWHTDDDVGYATLRVDGHREHHRIRSWPFRRWVILNAQDTDNKFVGRAAVDDIVDMMEANALRAPQYEVHLRTAEHDGEIYVDLVDEKWRAVRITASVWQVVEDPPVRFTRTAGMLPLPEPEPDGTLDELKPFVNLETGDDWLLFFGVVIGAFRPQGPYPVAIFHGEQGTAKSTIVRVIRALADPNKAPTRAQPRNEDDLYIAARNSRLLSFDNMSYLTGNLSDALCRISTGGGYSKRRLYTDEDEMIFDVCRMVLLNGIPEIVRFPDLMDRSIQFALPRIEASERLTEAAYWRKFEAARPRIFGAICDALSAGLRCYDKVELDELPRMADLVHFMTALEMGLGLPVGGFAKAYDKNRRDAMVNLAATDPLVEPILRIIRPRPFEGTATELLDAIQDCYDWPRKPPAGLPRLPNRLSGALRRLAPALREVGIEVEMGHGRDEKNRHLIRIWRVEEAKAEDNAKAADEEAADPKGGYGSDPAETDEA